LRLHWKNYEGGGIEQLPLSEHEQRILHQLEQSLYQEDPDFAERVRSETVYRHAGRHCVWSALVFVAALVFMFFTFAHSVPLGFVGVLVMFVSGVIFANNARRMGKAGIDDISRNIQNRTVNSPNHDPREWIRGRFQRDD